jgi:hypothetical protein
VKGVVRDRPAGSLQGFDDDIVVQVFPWHGPSILIVVTSLSWRNHQAPVSGRGDDAETTRRRRGDHATLGPDTGAVYVSE